MSEITLEGIAEVVRVKLGPVKLELSEHTKTLARHSEILNSHSQALQQLLTVREKTKKTKLQLLPIGLIA